MQKELIFTLIKNLKDQKSLEVKDKIQKVADLNTNLLVCGETGVGKDFWINYLFEISKYPNILNLNCGDVPDDLLESEWFGHKKGAFTGAVRDYEGKWQQAGEGILFLNQIDLLHRNLQTRLLRIIERKKYYPLGAKKERSIDSRFVFSVDADIEKKVDLGEFRQDLFYRISTFKIDIPPLRERKKDIKSLINYFGRQKKLDIRISAKSWSLLINHSWEGNIREIENFINNVSVMSNQVTDFEVINFIHSRRKFLDTLKFQELSLAKIEKEYITFLLRKYKSKVKVAGILGVSRKTLYNKMEKYEKD